MKKVLSLITVFTFMLSMAGCTSDYMEERVTLLETENETLKTENETLKTENETLTESNTELLSAKVLLETTNQTLLTEKEALTTQKATLETSITDLQGQLAEAKSDDRIALETEIAALQLSLDTVNAELEATFDGAIALKTESTITVLPFRNSDDLSLFDLIDNSELTLEYSTSEYGHMITEIGTVQATMFKWVSLLINGESAMAGVDSLEYTNGDIIEFTEETITWNSTFIATFNLETAFSSLEFTTTQGETFYIAIEDLPEGFSASSLIIGSTYQITGMSEVGSKGWGCSNCVIPTAVVATYTTDFTELYDLEIGEEVFLQFTLTEVSAGWQWGQEIKAKDENELLSKDVTSHLLNPFDSGYLFYTMPTELDLEVDKTYVAKFTFDLYPPNSKGQLGLSGIDADGNIDYSTVEFYELDDLGAIVRSVVTYVDDSAPVVTDCSGFTAVRDEMNTGDQCIITFTVTSISWDTPQATDALGVASTDIMGYMFDPSWTGTEVGKTYTVTIEKLANGQIKLIGDLTEAVS